MRVLFMGTPETAAEILRSLAERYEVVGAFCQPDKPVGRKQILTPPPVKEAALELGIPVFQPRSVRKQETLDLVRALEPDCIAVVAYGRILPQETSFKVTLEHAATAKQSAQRDKARSRAERMNILYG